MGRTARQGKKGTYSMVLLEAEVIEKFGLSERELMGKSSQELYRLLADARQRSRAPENTATEERLQIATDRDKLTHDFMDALLAGDARASDMFKELYTLLHGTKSRSILKRSRMICLSDATGSMGVIWNSTKQFIKEMLYRIKQIGGENLELMWMAYRDYDVPRLLLEKPKWTSDPNQLQSFVDSIVCTGGGDFEEAIEYAFMGVRKEHEKNAVTRVVLIGDAPPHWQRKGQIAQGAVLQTDYRLEVAELARLGVPVFTFHVGNHTKTKAAFEEIANGTGGTCTMLENPDDLLDVVCLNALEDIGGGDLVTDYKGRYQSKS